MKKFTKLLGIVLIMALVMSISVSAFAADPTGTITIKNSEKDTEYDFYKILGLVGRDTSDPADGTYDAVTYTIEEAWIPFFTANQTATWGEDDIPVYPYLAPADEMTLGQQPNMSRVTVNGQLYLLNIHPGNVVDFTNDAMEYALTHKEGTGAVTPTFTKTGTGNDVVNEDLALGYYLMIPVDASIKNANSSGSVASITSTLPNADILVKAEKPKIEKKDDAVSADVGQTVTYTVTGTVPNTSGYDTYEYVIKDEMTNGLTFNKDVKVEIVTDATTTPATTVDVTETAATFDYSTSNAFSADIAVKNLQNYIGKTIQLTYTATVNDNAVTNTQDRNKVHLEYGHNPSDLEKTKPIEEEVYSAKIVINKYTGDDETDDEAKLADAQFALLKIEVTENEDGTTTETPKYYKYTAAEGTNPAKVEWVEVTGAPTSGTANVTDAQAKALEDAGTAITTKTTTATGAAEFPGLKDGTYYLVEFKAPTGYNRLATPYEVKVEGKDADKAEGKTENVADATGKFDEAVNPTADVQNNSGAVLPSTGGIGTTIFYVVGSILVVAAGVLLITKKRMSREG
jgi:fimbrial isopeptide formation D2 family protein/LPXTG-motif cell wall-anchored protein